MSYEKITVVGNVGVPEVLTSAQGNSYVRISVAVTRPSQGNRATWYSVLLFGPMAKEPHKLVERYKRGRLVLVEGRPQTEPFVRKDGTPGVENTIIATAYPELLDKP
jgi:single-stranded DNA-binding protein